MSDVNSGSVSDVSLELGLFVSDKRVLVSSRSVAMVFGKRHDKVLRDIRELGCSEEFRLSNFGESSYRNEQGREMPEFLMTRDGFAFLAMGYTGEKAAKFKEMYIAAFNAMEEALVRRGYYMPDDPTLLGLPDFRDPSKAALAWVEERDGRLLAEALVEELRPKAEYCDRVLEANNIYLVTDIAKDYGMSAFAFNRLLGDLGIQYRLGDPRHGRWHLYAKYQDKGYTQSMTKTVRGGQVVTFMAWTETGRMFLYQLLKRNGYLPVAEAQEREARRSAALVELASSGDAGSREA